MDTYQIDGHKLDQHPERTAQWREAGDDLDALMQLYPIYVEISPNGACNHRCVFCSVDYIGYQTRQLDAAALEQSLADMGRHGVKSVMFAGEGEPLLARGLPEMIDAAYSAGIDVAITTNATNLTQSFAELSLQQVTWLKASVNGGDPDTYAAVHRTKPNDFARVIENLARAVDIRRRSHDFEHIDQGGQPIDCTLGAQIVLIRENIHSAVALAKICRDIGLDYLVIKPYSQNPHSVETATRGFADFDYRHWLDLEARLREFETDTFQIVYREKTMASLYQERGYDVCHATPHFWAYIMATGEVYGCSAHLLDDRFKFGNIYEQSFSDIWQGAKRRACLELMRTFDVGECRKNCRMNAENKYLHQLKHPAAHVNFI